MTTQVDENVRRNNKIHTYQENIQWQLSNTPHQVDNHNDTHESFISDIYRVDNRTITQQFFQLITHLNVSDIADLKHLSPEIFFINRAILNKRIKRWGKSQADAQYFYENCYIRTRTRDGNPIGLLFLISAESVRNPFRSLIESLHYQINDGQTLPFWLASFLEGVNTAADIVLSVFTGSAYSFLKNASIKALTIFGHMINGEDLCIDQEISAEEQLLYLIHSLPQVGDIVSVFDLISFASQSAELQYAEPFIPNSLFLHENMGNGILSTKDVLIDYRGHYYLAKEDNPGSYFLYDPLLDKTEKSARLHFDAESNKLYIDTPSMSQRVSYSVISSSYFVTIQGNYYEIIHSSLDNTIMAIQRQHYNKDVTILLPIYMEPLSKTWHLSMQNNHAVFSAEQQLIVNRIAVNRNSNYYYTAYENEDPFHYGNARLWKVLEPKNITHHYIEINGQLAPVTKLSIHGKRIVYQIYNLNDPLYDTHAIEWDGLRWIFEQKTSPHLTQEVQSSIPSYEYQKPVNNSQLSPPDQYGLRWNQQQLAFLKNDFRFVEIYKPYTTSSSKMRERFILAAAPKRLRRHLRFQDNVFSIESTSQRLQHIATIPFGCNITALDILKKQTWLNDEDAQLLLRNYAFPASGFFSELAFAIDIEQMGELPQWSYNFKKESGGQSLPTVNNTIKMVTAYEIDLTTKNNRLSLIIPTNDNETHQTSRNIYVDNSDQRYVIKEYDHAATPHPIPVLLNFGRHKKEQLQRYYGTDSTSAFWDNASLYLRTYAIPGRRLVHLTSNTLRPAPTRLLDMLEKLTLLGIKHSDLTVNNIVWDAHSNSFYPIDIHSINISNYPYRESLPEQVRSQLTIEQITELLDKIREINSKLNQ